MFAVIGITTLDLFISGLDRMPRSGGDEFTTDNLAFVDRPLTLVLGGNGANAAYALARLGAPTRLCSAVGSDIPGSTALSWLAEAGVDTQGILRSDPEATATTTVITDAALNRLSFHHRGICAGHSVQDMPVGFLDGAKIVLISGVPLLPGWRGDGIARALGAARQAGAVTALDIGPAIGEPVRMAELQPLLPNVDYLLGNGHELAVCTGDTQDPVEENVRRAFAAGAQCLVIKQGRRGALVCRAESGDFQSVPGFQVQARFTVGAGDSFNAGFLFGVAQGWEVTDAARFGNGLAALVVSGTRGVLGAPSRQEVEELVRAGVSRGSWEE